LLGWYWRYGCLRQGKYALPTGVWLDQLYSTAKELDTLDTALAAHRPSVAVWGPSQTGKSALAASYIDARAYTGGREVDGTGSGLHWDGGTPCFFLTPEENALERVAMREGTLVLNPYNSGLDASACLSRFVLGSPEPTPGLHHVRDPQHPVELKWVKPAELWQSIARGYDSQCFGPRTPGLELTGGRILPRYPRTWTHERFLERLRHFSEEPVPSSATPSREAYELLHDFCDLIEDLIFAELPRFRQLQSADSSWRALRHAVLSETTEGPGGRNALHYDPARAYAFTAEVLWDGYKVLSDYHQAMRRVHQSLHDRWQDKPVFCSLEVAALLLDMETYLVHLKPLPGRPRAKDVRIHRTVPAVAWEDRGDHIVIGADPKLPHKLVQGPEHFAILQGLVWEMVIPLNPDRLDNTPFKSFLHHADLLDFPGVERGGQSADKIDLDVLARIKAGSGGPEEGTGERDAPYQFFLRLLKRGKTSSIVCTYAQRLSIDAFNIFQDLDKDKPNGTQLIEGINSWWKECAPEFYHNPRGRSPLPLNFALVWWAEFFNSSQDFTNLAKKFAGLGSIIDPEVSTTFALNYYSLPRGRIEAERLAAIEESVATLKAEPAFRMQFVGETSLRSFEEMIADRESGGTHFFFACLSRQIQGAVGENSPRLVLLRKKAANLLAQLGELMQQHELYPNPAPKDERRDHLLRFQAALDQAVDRADERHMRRMNHALRVLLDIDFTDFLPVPRAAGEINVEHLRTQLQQWINSKAELLSTGRAEFAAIGCGERETLVATLTALAESIEPDLESTALWLRRLLQHARAAPSGDEIDLRRHLALRLSNHLVFGPAGPRVRTEEPFDQPATEEDPEKLAPEPSGRACRYYRDFIAAFAGPDGQLQTLTHRQVIPITRPEQPGDAELLALSRSVDIPDPDIRLTARTATAT
ncbi:MAG TPA: hypothetical protein VGD81_13355, partial [Opitutaceae bacterium]